MDRGRRRRRRHATHRPHRRHIQRRAGGHDRRRRGIEGGQRGRGFRAFAPPRQMAERRDRHRAQCRRARRHPRPPVRRHLGRRIRQMGRAAGSPRHGLDEPSHRQGSAHGDHHHAARHRGAQESPGLARCGGHAGRHCRQRGQSRARLSRNDAAPLCRLAPRPPGARCRDHRGQRCRAVAPRLDRSRAGADGAGAGPGRRRGRSAGQRRRRRLRHRRGGSGRERRRRLRAGRRLVGRPDARRVVGAG